MAPLCREQMSSTTISVSAPGRSDKPTTVRWYGGTTDSAVRALVSSALNLPHGSHSLRSNGVLLFEKENTSPSVRVLRDDLVSTCFAYSMFACRASGTAMITTPPGDCVCIRLRPGVDLVARDECDGCVVPVNSALPNGAQLQVDVARHAAAGFLQSRRVCCWGRDCVTVVRRGRRARMRHFQKRD